MYKKMKIIRVATVPMSLNLFCRGLLSELAREGYEVVALSSSDPDLDEIEKREGVRAVRLEMARDIAPAKDIQSLLHLIRTFRREKPQIVHSITPKAGLLSMCAAWVAGVPYRVHTFTGLIFPTSSGLRRKILKTTDKLTCFFATHIIPEGEGVKHDLLQNRITSKPLKILRNGSLGGVEINHFNPDIPEIWEKASLLRNENIFTFIFVGRLAGDKGINELIQAFIRLNKENRDTRLRLIGWDETESDPISEASWKEIMENHAIKWHGYQSDVRPWILASDCLVLPSYREGFPNVVLEATALGCPCIVTDINGSNEIITHGRSGIIVPPKDTQALYEAMKSSVDNPEMLRPMAAEAKKNVREKYNRRIVYDAIKDFYRSLLA